MATFISTIKFTEQGIQNIKDTCKRSNAFKAAAKKMGVKVQDIYWTLGPFDGLLVFNAPDEETATALMLHLGSLRQRPHADNSCIQGGRDGGNPGKDEWMMACVQPPTEDAFGGNSPCRPTRRPPTNDDPIGGFLRVTYAFGESISHYPGGRHRPHDGGHALSPTASRSVGRENLSKRRGLVFAIALRLAGLCLWIAVFAYLLFPASVHWAAVPLPAWVRWFGVVTGDSARS